MSSGGHLFAVVDVETTGGKPSDTKITEIAIIISDGKNILEEFSTLVNPHKKIDWYVSKLTGITDEMVAVAPTFEDSSERIKELLAGKIFVAHNVEFDYNIVKREFLEIGKPLENQKLCTVKSAKKVFQHLSSYSLGNLSEYLNISLPNAHRALDDTRATTELLHRILEKVDFDFLYSELKHQNHIVDLPEHWTIRDGKSIEASTGLIYFHDAESKIIYVDYTNNFQKKLYTIIDSARNKDVLNAKLVRQTASITLDEVGDLFKAEMKMLNDIQFHKPKFNKPFKAQNDLYSLYLKKDDRGLLFFSISRTKGMEDTDSPIVFSASFKNAEKIKNKFNLSSDIAQLAVLKKRINAEDSPVKDYLVNQYNQTFLDKLYKEYCCSFKNGYYIFNIYGENQFDAIEVKDFYLHSWGQGAMEGNKVLSFQPEFEFEKNQKLTRKFLNILPKTSFKILKTDEPSVLY